MSEGSAETKSPIEAILDALDVRLQPSIRASLTQPGPARWPQRHQTLVVAGHRAAGKTRILPWIQKLSGRPGLDLDAELERRHGRSLREWVIAAPEAFRAAERALFLSLPPGGLVAVGGGFLSHHPEALTEAFTVLVPISYETYRERLLADTSRPRLRPHVSLEEELQQIFSEREQLHARVPTVPLVDLLRSQGDLGAAP